MKELYFISVLGTINDVAWVLFGCVIAFLIIVAVPYVSDIFYTKEKDILKKWLRLCAFVIAPITLVVGIFTPSKKDMYMIYGVGSVIDYVQESDEAKQLPDKTIKMLNALAEKYTPEETKESEQ